MPILSNLKLLAFMGVGIIIATLILLLAMEKRHSRKLTERNAALVAELHRISTAKNEQAETSKRTVERVVKGDPVIIRQVERIENAPLPGECRTPHEVMGADL